MSHAKATPVGGPLWTPTTRLLLVIGLIGLGLTAWRFAVGLGPSTGLTDGYPWGLWIAFDVVTGTALACGGYAIALLAYVFNKGRYHPLVRPALLTAALGYSIAAVGIIIDVGRPWLIWKIPVSIGKWNLNSALLEVALCVMSYLIVLYIELSPAFFEKWDEGKGGFASFSRSMAGFMDRILIVFIALGILLPTMHQSSLGTVIMLAGPRLHPLWHTGWLPLLFLLSCLAMGYSMVVLESTFSSRAFKTQREDRLLTQLGGVVSLVLFVFLALRFGDIFYQGKASLLFTSGGLSVLFWIETALFLLPAIMLAARRNTIPIACMFRSALMIALGGILYRFDAYLAAFDPGPGWGYFPTIPEMAITIGLVSLEILVFILLVKRFPILSGTSPAAADRGE